MGPYSTWPSAASPVVQVTVAELWPRTEEATAAMTGGVVSAGAEATAAAAHTDSLPVEARRARLFTAEAFFCSLRKA